VSGDSSNSQEEECGKLPIVAVVADCCRWLNHRAQEPLVIWHALSREDTGVIADVADAFSAASGIPVEVHFVEPTVLYESAASALASGEGPDVIIADNSLVEPLLDNSLIAPMRGSGDFFLASLLDNLPPLVEARCGDDSVTDCLWPGVSPVLPVPVPDETLAEHTADWLCESSDWLPFCRGGGIAGVPLSWWYNLYLLDVSWSVQQGFEPPTDAKGVLELRSDYGLTFVEAREGSIPTVQDADFPPVYVIGSPLMVDEPDDTMRSMASFLEAGYTAVPDLHVDVAYISAGAHNPDAAQQFVDFLQGNPDTQIALMDSSQRLPAFGADALRRHIDTEAGLATLQAVNTLAGVAAHVF
jgi:ABC-type glycerol-3-phosphate transport system substrate-binding protein